MPAKRFEESGVRFWQLEDRVGGKRKPLFKMVAVKVEDMELGAKELSTRMGEFVRLVFRAGLDGSRGPVV